MKFKILFDIAGSDYDIHVSPEGTELHGKASFTLRSGPVSVAVTQSGAPVFLRIRGAQDLDAFMASLHSRIPGLISGQDKLSAEERAKVVAFATEKMQEVVQRRIQRQVKDMQSWSQIENSHLDSADLEMSGATV